MEEGTDDARAPSEAEEGVADTRLEDLQVGRALAGEGVLLHPSPQPLIGIEFGRVGRKAVHAQPGVMSG